MSIKGVEAMPFIGFMGENDGGTVVQSHGVVGDAVHDTVINGMHR